MNNPTINYRHHYHAGNFADVFKHITLILLIQALLKKEKPFCYLDLHAGAGLYDLQETAAQKTREYTTGLLPLLQEKKHPEIVKSYLEIVHSYNPQSAVAAGALRDSLPRYYPGSPCVAHYFLRAQDKMILNDVLPENVQALQALFHKDKRVSMQKMDAYQALKALLPPKEKRGLVLIDPPYERADEFNAICSGISEGMRRWATGIYAIWYPIKDTAISHKFLRRLEEQIKKEWLVAEIMIYADDINIALNGCGMAIINPPWQLDVQLNELLPWLWQVLSPEKKGGYQVSWRS